MTIAGMTDLFRASLSGLITEVFAAGTYADIIARNRRPFVILNATDMTTGSLFPFIQDQFDLLCSDLAGVPLGRAAAASSAFPASSIR